LRENFNTKILSFLSALFLLVVLTKIVWVAVEYIYLPELGIDKEIKKSKNSLYYRYRFASDEVLPKIKTRPTKNLIKKAPSIKDLKLVGIYSGTEESIVTIIKKKKSYTISTGEEIDGFILKRATEREAYFEKNQKIFVLKLYDEKKRDKSRYIEEEKQKIPVPAQKNSDVIDRDGIKVIPRSMLTEYTSDMSKIVKDIGLRPVNKNGSLRGYKVRFIRRKSPFGKLGLKRGDIIKAINGEEIVDLSGPMSIFKSASTIDELTLTVIRGKEEKELEYEVK